MNDIDPDGKMADHANGANDETRYISPDLIDVNVMANRLMASVDLLKVISNNAKMKLPIPDGMIVMLYHLLNSANESARRMFRDTIRQIEDDKKRPKGIIY